MGKVISDKSLAYLNVFPNPPAFLGTIILFCLIDIKLCHNISSLLLIYLITSLKLFTTLPGFKYKSLA